MTATKLSHTSRKSQYHAISRQIGWSVLLLTFILFTLGRASAQLTTADIVGTVTDATGAVVPNANVVLTNTGTNEKRSAQTSGSGDYSFTLLQSGHYTIAVKSQGFKASITQNVAIEAGDRARADVHLQLGSESTVIEVQATTPLLQADNATVSSTVTEKAVQDLPLNGRNFVQLVQLVPGANEGPGNGLTSGGRPDDRRMTAGFSVNGQDDTLNNYIIDGIDNNERIIGTIGVRPNVEGIQEISVQTNSYAPEAGRTAGGVVNIVTKSGTNQFHGSVYEYFRNDIFDARNFFSRVGQVPKAELRQNQYGASIGGPIWKNRTFFFGDYEGFRQVTGGTTFTSTVPTLAQYNDIHSLNGGSPQQLINQGNGTQGLPIHPIALNYLMLFPAPQTSGTANNYIINPNKTQNSNVFDIRIDHHFNANNLFFGRYTYNKVDTYTPAQLPASITSGPLAGIIAGGGRFNFSGPSTDAAQQYAFDYTHIFGPNLVMDLKAAYTRINNQSLPLNYGVNADTTVGFGPNMNFNQLASGLTPISLSGFPDLGDGAYVPLQDIDNTFQYMGTVSATLRNHNVKFGAGLIRRQARNVQSASALGFFTFGLSTDSCAPGTGIDSATGACATPATSAEAQANTLASTLAGAYTSNSRNYDLTPPDYRSWEPSAFVQDNWKLRPNLTLIYGVRYDVFTPFTEAHNHISNFDFGQAIGSTPDTVASALKVAGVDGVSKTADIQTIYTDVAPRVGFAYTPYPGTVLRGGYGLSFFPGNYTSNADLKNPPFTSNYAPGCGSSTAYNIQLSLGASANSILPNCGTTPGSEAFSTFAAGVPLPAPQSIASPGLSFVAQNPRLLPALIQQFNLQVEQEFGPNVFTFGYVGNIGQHLPQTINDINMPPPNNVGLNRPLFTLLPNVATVAYLSSEGISNYNALQTSFQRRFNHGLAFDANYVWGHALSDTTGFSEEGDQGVTNADPTRIRQIDYGNAENDIRSRFALSLNYQLPFGKEFTGAKKIVLAGWSANTIAVFQSGKPFSIINSASDGGFNNRASPKYNNGGPDRPDQVGNPNLSHKSLGEFFNTDAFAPQPLGTVGDARRNSLYGPHFRHVDLSVFKDFRITERLGLQFRAESFNISNTPSFFLANTNSGNQQLGNGSFGKITQTDPNYSPRQYQFALRLQF